MTLRTQKFIKDDGRAVEADMSYRLEDGVVEIAEVKAWLWEDRFTSNSPFVDLTDAEIERLTDAVQILVNLEPFDEDMD